MLALEFTLAAIATCAIRDYACRVP